MVKYIIIRVSCTSSPLVLRPVQQCLILLQTSQDYPSSKHANNYTYVYLRIVHHN